jgi:hypothetical protein
MPVTLSQDLAYSVHAENYLSCSCRRYSIQQYTSGGSDEQFSENGDLFF